MAWNDLTPTEQQQVKDFIRNYRAAIGDTVRGLRAQQLLAMAYTTSVSDLWAEIANGDLIPDESGLAGIITRQQAADINALGDVTLPSRASVIGVGEVAEADIQAARNWRMNADAEAARLTEYSFLRERVLNTRNVLPWLQSLQDAGYPAPAWDDVLARM